MHINNWFWTGGDKWSVIDGAIRSLGILSDLVRLTTVKLKLPGGGDNRSLVILSDLPVYLVLPKNHFRLAIIDLLPVAINDQDH